MAIDLFIYAIVAAGLVLWLRSVLGTRHGDERQRPNPFTPQEPQKAEKTAAAGMFGIKTGTEDAAKPNRISELAATPGKIAAIEGKPAEDGLLAIAAADRGFDIDFFMQAAQDSYAMIVESFAAGDRDTLKELLAPAVFETFSKAIDERSARDETMHAEITAIRKAAVTAARFESGRMAMVTIRFEADEISVTQAADGTVIAGQPERVSPATDVWSFGRDLKSADPRWLVYETSGGGEPSYTA